MHRSVAYALAAIMVVLLAAMSAGCSRVIEPGRAGVKVNNWGKQRGVQDFPIQTGRVMYNPITEDIYSYPTFLQNVVWSKNDTKDESVTITSSQGSSVNVDIGAGITISQDAVPWIFVNYHMDMEHLIHGPIFTEIRDRFIRHGGEMPIMDILGPRVGALMDSVCTDMNKGEFGQHGITFHYVTFVNKPRPDPKVEESINAVIQASQRAQEAMNKVVEARAVAQQNVESARGDSLATVIRAQGQAEANRLLDQSLTGKVIEYAKINKWDGKVPQVVTAENASTLVSVK